MNGDLDTDRFVKAPALLADLCREVIARIDVDPPDAQDTSESATMEAQLREIAKTIDRLEKMDVPIPDVLRVEKTRLAAALGVQDEATKALEQLADSLGVVLREIRISLNRRKSQPVSSGGQVERVNPERLPRSAMRNSIVFALRNLGGSAPKEKVLELVETELHGSFLSADLVWLESSRKYAWQNSAKHARAELVGEGILRSDSPKGVWELSEDQS